MNEMILKFRAWDEGNKVMHYKFQWISSGEESNDWICFKSMQEEPVSDPNGIVFNNPYFRQQLKIMQYANKQDKGGSDIYQGDILRDKLCIDDRQPDGFQYRYHLVEFTDMNDCGYNTRVVGLSLPDHLDDCEVIGNIYETPDWKENFFKEK